MDWITVKPVSKKIFLLILFLTLLLGGKKILRFITADREYYPNGHLKRYREHVLIDTNIFQPTSAGDGKSYEYFEDGKIKHEVNLAKDKKEGPERFWSSGGLKTDEWFYKNGK